MLNLKDPSLLRDKCLVNGEWLAADDGTTIAVENRADGEIVGTVPRMGTPARGRAVDATQEAFLIWRTQTAKQRDYLDIKYLCMGGIS